jgi:hypothetical protein
VRNGPGYAVLRAMKVAGLGVLAYTLVACATGEDDIGNDEPADYEVDPDDGKGDGVPATFNANLVVDESVFVDNATMDAADVQKFLETSPYRNRSWLADYKVNGVSAAEMIVRSARAEQIHPLMLLVRMQVEASLVSKTARPTQYRIDRALGCGCPDGAGCSASYRGFEPQLVCGAKILRKWYDGSVNASGAWRKGVARRTLDPRTVTPTNHATASLYAYTPWVLVGSGGNWLVWNVSRKYVRHAEATGLLQ